MKKLIRALLSRFKKTKTNPEVERKREICRTCPFNSKNSSKKTLKISLIQKLSKLYSILTNRAEEDDLGECDLCGCSLFYKTLNEYEECPDERW